ncbi:MAG: phosphoribosylglycinamide formyltransferase [Pseudomonadales bacterium]|nr:phosphoribosylglycinamide formyltransferase [Pseudomonadales bacterium]
MTAVKKKLVVLISGSGSNLQAFIDACANGDLNAQISCVIANKAEAFGLQRAADAGIKTAVVNHKDYDSREAFDTVLAQTIQAHKPDLVILAGFMRILTPAFVNAFAGKLMNIHPSLLPKYTGLNTHQRAIDAGDDFAGVTVHFVTPELDGGPPILQAKVAIDASDDAESLAQKVLQKEHIIYPLATKWFLDGQLTLQGNSVLKDKDLLSKNGLLYQE